MIGFLRWNVIFFRQTIRYNIEIHMEQGQKVVHKT